MVDPAPHTRGTRPDDDVLAELAQVFTSRPQPDGDGDDTDDTPTEASLPDDAAPLAPTTPATGPDDADDSADAGDADATPADGVPVDQVPGDEVPVQTGPSPDDAEESGDADAADPIAAGDSTDESTDDVAGSTVAVDDEPPRRSGGTDPLLRPRPPVTATAGPGDGASRQTIAIDADDDLPDAVYLDDELAGSDSSSGTVFIDDDDVADPLAAKDATGSSIEPRFRQRLIGVRRSEGLRRLRLIAAITAVVLVVGGGLAVLGSPLFDIDDVSVDGAVYTDPVALQEVVDDLQGTPVLLADTRDAEDRLEDIPWVEDARVSTQFPSGASIELRERMPLVTMRGTDGLFRVLDREGRVLDSIEGQPVAMVLITGPGTLDIAPGEFAPIGYSAAASLVTKFTPEIRVRVQSMLVTPDGSDLRLVLANGDAPPIEVEFGSALGDNDQIEKLVRLQRALDDIGTDPVSVINVSTAEVTVV